MSQNSESSCQKRENVLKTESLEFSEIPHQSRLFIDYQKKLPAIQKFYPHAVSSISQILQIKNEVTANYTTDRNTLCNALESDNKSFGAGGKAFENIEFLRDEECVAVVTGQQAGLFSGAIYTIYKALSAVKAAECLRGQGVKAVPVFWIAEEDHDFDEVKETEIIDRQGQLKSFFNKPKNYRENLPVGAVKLDETISEIVKNLTDSLTETEFSVDLKTLLNNSYQKGETFSSAFAKFLAELFADYGLIIFAPLNQAFKKLAAPIFTKAVKNSEEIRAKLLKRNDELEAGNYHAQVLVEEDFFPFFWFDENGERQSLKFKVKDSIYQAKNGRKFSLEELTEIAENQPEKLSPNALMRPVVQDFLLPTICYFGGAAEIAYFAQNSVIYETLKRPVTTAFHRQSLTIIEAKHQRTLAKYDMKLKDLFAGFEKILPPIVEKFIDPQTARKIIETENNFSRQLDDLRENLSKIEPTLADNLDNRRKKILYHLSALQTKFYHAQICRDETINRQIETMFAALLPHDALQERTLNVSVFLNRYGKYFINWIYDTIDLEDKAHRIIYI